MIRTKALFSITALAAAAACASTKPTQELKDARQAQIEAQQGRAVDLVPDLLYESRAALQEAEDAHEAEPGSFREKSLAYIAERKAQEAATMAEKAHYEQVSASSGQREQEILQKQRDVAEMSLKDTEDELTKVREQLQQRGEAFNQSLRQREAQLKERQQQLEAERAARKDAEERAQAALASLDELAKVKQEQRKLTITLSGAVLFEFGKSALLPSAKRRLDEVATALAAQGDDKQITVEGHTDSIGTPENNRELSKERARAVREYIVSKGLDGGRVRAVGRGESEPIANNSTPEGRANNRRVELVIEARGKIASGASRGQPS